MIAHRAAAIAGHDAPALTDWNTSPLMPGLEDAAPRLRTPHTTRVREFGAILVVVGSGSGIEIERSARTPAHPSIDIIFTELGNYSYLDRGLWAHSTDPLIIAPSDAPHHLRFAGHCDIVLTRIPQSLLPSSTLTATEAVTTHADLTVAERAMRAFLSESAHSTRALTRNDGHAVDRMVIEMTASVLRDRSGGTRYAPGMPLRDRALAQIIAEAASVALTPQKIANDCGISLRHLQSVFANAGTSVAAELRRERARIALLMLQDSRFDHIGIEVVAEQSGFGSSVSMRRALRDCFHSNPKELRQRRDGIATKHENETDYL